MGCAKRKLLENCKKLSENRKIHVIERGAICILFYSICAVVPDYITGVKKQCQNHVQNAPKFYEHAYFFVLTGIEINTWKIHKDGDDITYNVWDFAGQTVYYNTHQVNIDWVYTVANRY